MVLTAGQLTSFFEDANQMGLSGHEYVRRNYGWDTVMEGVEEALLLAQSQFATRRHALKR